MCPRFYRKQNCLRSTQTATTASILKRFLFVFLLVGAQNPAASLRNTCAKQIDASLARVLSSTKRVFKAYIVLRNCERHFSLSAILHLLSSTRNFHAWQFVPNLFKETPPYSGSCTEPRRARKDKAARLIRKEDTSMARSSSIDKTKKRGRERTDVHSFGRSECPRQSAPYHARRNANNIRRQPTPRSAATAASSTRRLCPTTFLGEP